MGPAIRTRSKHSGRVTSTLPLNRDFANTFSCDLTPEQDPLASIVGPFTKAGGYYARSWGAYLGGSRNELPVARPTLSLATHALRDELVLVGLLWKRPLSDPAAYQRDQRAKSRRPSTSTAATAGWRSHRISSRHPSAPTEVSIRKFSTRNRTHERLSFDSGYAPHPDEPGAERWMSYTGNHREYALMLRHRETTSRSHALGWCASTAPRWVAPGWT